MTHDTEAVVGSTADQAATAPDSGSGSAPAELSIRDTRLDLPPRPAGTAPPPGPPRRSVQWAPPANRGGPRNPDRARMTGTLEAMRQSLPLIPRGDGGRAQPRQAFA